MKVIYKNNVQKEVMKAKLSPIKNSVMANFLVFKSIPFKYGSKLMSRLGIRLVILNKTASAATPAAPADWRHSTETDK
jgi:hypothetical protein